MGLPVGSMKVPGTTIPTPPPNPSPMPGTNGGKRGLRSDHILGVRHVLRLHGYDVDKTGVLTDRLLSAWKTYRAGGKGAAWSAAHSRKEAPPPAGAQGPITQAVVNKMPKKTAPPKNTPSKNPKGKPRNLYSGGGGGGGGGGGNNGLVIPSLGNPNIGNLLNPNMVNQGAELYDPNMADSLAGIQFDPAIRDVRTAQQRQGVDAAQHQADLTNWYRQVQDQLHTAAGRNQDASAKTTASMGKATQGILDSLGGSASGASGMVGAQGAADANTQALLGQAESQYQNDLSPLLGLEQAGARREDAAAQTKVSQDLLSQLTNLQGQRGQAESNQRLALMQDNNQIKDSRLSNLLNLREYNNSVLQQRYGNKLSAQQAAIAAAMGGAQVGYYNASTKAANASGGSGWMGLKAGDRSQLVHGALQDVIDPTTGALIGNPNDAKDAVRKSLVAMGYTNAKYAKKGHTKNRASKDMLSMIQVAIQHAIDLRKQAQAAAANTSQ